MNKYRGLFGIELDGIGLFPFKLARLVLLIAAARTSSSTPITLLDEIARRLNERPRKTLDYETPADGLMPVLQRSIESTVESGMQYVDVLLSLRHEWAER